MGLPSSPLLWGFWAQQWSTVRVWTVSYGQHKNPVRHWGLGEIWTTPGLYQLFYFFTTELYLCFGNCFQSFVYNCCKIHTNIILSVWKDIGTIYCYSKSYITLAPDSFELVINVFDFNSYKLMMILNFYVW